MSSYVARPMVRAPAFAVLPVPGQLAGPPVNLESPARLLLTDFRQISAISVLDSTQIDEALDRMRYARIKLLFVVDADFHLIGLITSFDIAGEKPLLHLQARDGHLNAQSRANIMVRDIMLPISDWLVLDYLAIERTRVGDIVQTFKRFGLRHLIVIERDADGSLPIVRGLFSATQFQRALGVELDIEQTPSTFAEIELALAHPR